jgi:OOP family OmpA-OmpF porin
MKSFIFFSLLFLSQFVRGQNLVINPSFEDTVQCNQINFPPQLTCYPWFMPTNGSTDYFREVPSCGWEYIAPTTMFGYQYARTGIAYCGLGIWLKSNIPTPNYREYLEGILIDTLKQGHTYCVSFYVVNCNITKYFSSDIQLYFSNDSVVDYTTSSNLSFVPQVANTNGIIYDTLNWVQISGIYIAGGGGIYYYR